MEKNPIPQTQPKQPGIESVMTPKPLSFGDRYKASGKLQGKVALITGGDSGIGRAVAILFAKEGADIAIIYKSARERDDAVETRDAIEKEDRACLLMQGDVGDEFFCHNCIEKVLDKWKDLNIVVNNAAVQYPQKSLTGITQEQLMETFRTNIFSYFYLSKAALKYLGRGDVILNTTSVTAYKGRADLIDYSSTKGAIVSFTRALALSLVDQGIRVNGVAPGPIWTPLIPASFDEDQVGSFGKNVPMKRMGQPDEVAPCYVFLASDDASYITGQVLHPNGGTIING